MPIVTHFVAHSGFTQWPILRTRTLLQLQNILVKLCLLRQSLIFPEKLDFCTNTIVNSNEIVF